MSEKTIVLDFMNNSNIREKYMEQSLLVLNGRLYFELEEAYYG